MPPTEIHFYPTCYEQENKPCFLFFFFFPAALWYIWDTPLFACLSSILNSLSSFISGHFFQLSGFYSFLDDPVFLILKNQVQTLSHNPAYQVHIPQVAVLFFILH